MKENKNIDFSKTHINKNLQMIMKYTFIGMITGVIVALKMALAFLPNFETITFFLIFLTVYFKFDISFLAINSFCLLMVAFHGVVDWTVMYFIIFNLYFFITYSIKKVIFKFFWVGIIVAGLYGYIFGSLFTIQQWVLNGKAFALTYWIRGLIFDFIHGTCNAIIFSTLWPAFIKLVKYLTAKYPFLLNKQAFKIYKFEYQKNNNKTIE